MTRHSRDTPQFYLTAPSPCPYLAGKEERKVFTHLVGERASELNDLLTHGGFRRSQSIAYRPACETCRACVSVRVVVEDFRPSRSMRRVLDYAMMVEDSHVDTRIVEYRSQDAAARASGRGAGPLLGVALTDLLSDGLSMVYSFFEPDAHGRSVGTFIILDHIARARRLGLSYVYLGYWVKGSKKMDYKGRFLPQERLLPDGWTRFEA